ncbi:uncharacterized protein V6R79_026076 [Siganus canaliculatus]
MHHSFGRRREDHVWDSISPPSQVGPLLTPWLLSTGRRLPGGAWSSHRPSRAVGAGRGPYPRPPLHPPQLALDPPTREIAKQYFKIIQALHHKNIIDTAVEKQEPPRGMLRQILKLTSFIKPSSPSDSVRQAVQDNTTNWTLNNLRILQTHYSTLLSDFNPPPHNPLAFQVASKWAQKSSPRKRIKLTHAPAITHSSDEEDFVQPPPNSRRPPGNIRLQSNKDNISRQPPYTELVSRSFHPNSSTFSNVAVLDDDSIHQFNLTDFPFTPPGPTVGGAVAGRWGDHHGPAARPQDPTDNIIFPYYHKARPNRKLIEWKIHTHQDICIIGDSNLHRIPPFSATNLQIDSYPGAAFYHFWQILKTTPHRSSSPRKRIKLTHAPAITHSSDEEDFVQPPPNSRRPPGNIRLQSNKDNISRQPPYTELVSRSFHPNSSTFSNVAVLDDDSIHQFNLTDFPFTPPGPTVGGAVAGRWGDHHGPAARPQGGATGKVMTTQATLKQTHAANKATSDPKPSAPPAAAARGPGVLPAGRDAPPADPVEQNDRQTPHVNFNPDPTDNIIFPYYHKARPNRKLIEWKIHTHQDICIIGDSNLHRIPPFSATNLQIDSYPGAAFYHFWQILKTTPPQVQVKLLVLSNNFGIPQKSQPAISPRLRQITSSPVATSTRLSLDSQPQKIPPQPARGRQFTHYSNSYHSH